MNTRSTAAAADALLFSAQGPPRRSPPPPPPPPKKKKPSKKQKAAAARREKAEQKQLAEADAAASAAQDRDERQHERDVEQAEAARQEAEAARQEGENNRRLRAEETARLQAEEATRLQAEEAARLHAQQEEARLIAIEAENAALERQIDEDIIADDEMLEREARAVSEARRRQEINDDIDREQAENEARINGYNFRLHVVIKQVLPNGKKSAHWDQKIGEEHGHGYNPASMEVRINTELDIRNLDRNIDISVAVKSDNSRGTYQRATLQDFSLEQWAEQVEGLLRAQHKRYMHYDLQVNVEVLTRLRPPPPPPPPPPQPHPESRDVSPRRRHRHDDRRRSGQNRSRSPRRRTRTVRQEELAAENRDRNEAAGNFSEALVDKWLCTSDTCSNRDNTCFVTISNGNHYRINGSQREVWANNIPSGRFGASISRPPEQLFVHLVRNQGPVTLESRNPIAKANSDNRKDRFERIIDGLYQHGELAMATTFANLGSSIRPPSAPHAPIYTSPYAPPTGEPPPPPSPAIGGPSAAHPAPIGGLPASRSASGTPRGSSPIGPPTEDQVILQDFWKWVIAGAPNDDVAQLLANAQGISTRELWSLDDLKDLSNASSETHKHAMTISFPHGLAKKMRKLIHQFKVVYRTVYRPERIQLTNRQREEERHGGGFMT